MENADWWWNGSEDDRWMYMWPQTQRNPVYYSLTNFDGQHECSVDYDAASPGTRGAGTDSVPEEVRFIVFIIYEAIILALLLRL